MHRGHGSSAVPPQKVFERVITILIGLITHPASGRVFSAYALTDNTLIITIRRVSYLIGNISNILQKRSKTNRINVTAGQKATSRIIIDPIEGYTPVLATVWSSHVTTTVSDSRIVGSDAMFVFSADAQQTPETFTADVVYVKDIAL